MIDFRMGGAAASPWGSPPWRCRCWAARPGPLRLLKTRRPPDGRIGYVVWHEVSWGVRETPDHKEECPKGFNIGPREQFSEAFPNDGRKRTLVETQLKREADVWMPDTTAG